MKNAWSHIQLTPGLDIAWVDLDIFLLSDPTELLLKQALHGPGNDVLTSTRLWDETRKVSM